MLRGGLGRFVPCCIGANHCRLRHTGWERCGHGLTSRLRESAFELCFSILQGLLVRCLLGLFPFGTALLGRDPFWTLPVPGHVAGLITAEVQAAPDGGVEVAGRDVHWVSGPGQGWKWIRLNRKNPSTYCRAGE